MLELCIHPLQTTELLPYHRTRRRRRYWLTFGSAADAPAPTVGRALVCFQLLFGYLGGCSGLTGSFSICSLRYSTAALSWASSPLKVAWGRLSTTMSGLTPCPSISQSPSGP